MPDITVPEVIAGLSSNPRTFLQKHRIRCQGGTMNGPTTGRLAIMGGVPTFSVGGSDPNLPMWSFRMIPTSESINFDMVDHCHITANQPKFAVTGQLTGCTVIGRPISRTECRIAHIQPGGARGGNFETEVALETTGYLRGELPECVFGPSTYLPETGNAANVIGVFGKNGWEFWAQTYNRSSGAVKDVRQIM